MGANAQTTVPTFTAGQVLTADQQNQSARTGVPVFATTITRDAAFGGTGEKTLAEGQMCYVEGTGFQTYNGTAWVTWGTAPSTGALVYLTGATFSTVTSFSAPNDTFTSTYNNYRLIVDLSDSTTITTFTMRFRTAGTDNSTANYYQGGTGIDNNGNTRNLTGNGMTSFKAGGAWNGSPTYNYGLCIDILAPKLSRATDAIGSCIWSDNLMIAGTTIIAGFHGTTTFDSFSFISNVASSISGEYRVYGYVNS